MGDSTFAKYQSIIGHALVYFKSVMDCKWNLPVTTKYKGKLKGVIYVTNNIIPYGVFERLEEEATGIQETPYLQPRIDVVPLSQVAHKLTDGAQLRRLKLYTCRQSEQLIDDAASYSHNNNYNTFIHDHNEYTVTTMKEMTTNDQVVWVSECVPPMIGVVTWIGERLTISGHREVVAIVQFNEPTKTFPRFLKSSPANRNLINLEDLLLLSVWLKKKTEGIIVSASPQHRTVQPSSPIDIRGLKESGKRTASGITTSSKNENKISSTPQTNANRQIPSSSESKTYTSSADQWRKNSTETINNRDFNVTTQISPNAFVSAISNNQEQDKRFGIQGFKNSCYMDCSIYSLFAFNISFDNILFPGVKSQANPERNTKLAKKVRKILAKEIILTLRKEFFVSLECMKKLRDVFVKEIDYQYESSFMDSEEFIIRLFKLMDIPELFKYNHGGNDYIHQIFLPNTVEENQRKKFMTLQVLVEHSFSASEVKLSEIPESAFIIKLPVSNGKLIPCKAVIPNVTLDLSSVLENHHGKDTKKVAEMHLHAVICLRSNHFVTFVCIDHSDADSQWAFMDSRPTTSSPEVHLLQGTTCNIKQAEKSKKIQDINKMQPRCGGYKLFRDAYICVYVPK